MNAEVKIVFFNETKDMLSIDIDGKTVMFMSEDKLMRIIEEFHKLDKKDKHEKDPN